jgi:acetyl esterase/lipase
MLHLAMNIFKLASACSLVAVLAGTSMNAAELPEPIVLWPDGAPGSEGKPTQETVRITEGGDRVVSNVHQPSIFPYLPSADRTTGAAVIIAPGGGHRELWSTHEGHNLARWLSERGVAAFVLYNRLPREKDSTYTIDEHALADTQRAIQLVRSRSKEWQINRGRIGVMGFSAGCILFPALLTRSMLSPALNRNRTLSD